MVNKRKTMHFLQDDRRYIVLAGGKSMGPPFLNPEWHLVELGYWKNNLNYSHIL